MGPSWSISSEFLPRGMTRNSIKPEMPRTFLPLEEMLRISRERFLDQRHDRNYRIKQQLPAAMTSSKNQAKGSSTAEEGGTKREALGDDETVTCYGEMWKTRACQGCSQTTRSQHYLWIWSSSLSRNTFTANCSNRSYCYSRVYRSGIWIADSGTSYHMTYSRNAVYDFKSVTEHVELAGGTMSVRGWGKLLTLEALIDDKRRLLFELHYAA